MRFRRTRQVTSPGIRIALTSEFAYVADQVRGPVQD